METIRGHASFTADPEPTIEVDGKKYTAPHILIATGGRPVIPSDSEIPGMSSVMLFAQFIRKNVQLSRH